METTDYDERLTKRTKRGKMDEKKGKVNKSSGKRDN